MSDTPIASTEVVAAPQQPTAVSTSTRPKGLRDWLQAPEFKEQLSLACGEAIKPEHFLRVAITAMNKNPKLLDCTKESVFRCMLDSAAFGVELNGRDAHLIPYGKEATLIIDYKGYVRLVMNTGLVSNIHADVVCENDDFEYNLGEVKRHVIDFKKPRGAVYAVYCIVTMKDGTKKADVMSDEEVEVIRKRSRSGNSGPWITDRNEMRKKTVFRRLQKWLPLSPEIQEKLDKDMRTEFAELADSIRQRPRQNFLATMGDADATETDEPPFPAEEGKQ